jgi:hypothetical protein
MHPPARHPERIGKQAAETARCDVGDTTPRGHAGSSVAARPDAGRVVVQPLRRFVDHLVFAFYDRGVAGRSLRRRAEKAAHAEVGKVAEDGAYGDPPCKEQTSDDRHRQYRNGSDPRHGSREM